MERRASNRAMGQGNETPGFFLENIPRGFGEKETEFPGVNAEMRGKGNQNLMCEYGDEVRSYIHTSSVPLRAVLGPSTLQPYCSDCHSSGRLTGAQEDMDS